MMEHGEKSKGWWLLEDRDKEKGDYWCRSLHETSGGYADSVCL